MVQSLASHAGVFRGARFLWGGQKYELPEKRLRGRLVQSQAHRKRVYAVGIKNDNR